MFEVNVDITSCINDLNLKLQGLKQHIASLVANIKRDEIVLQIIATQPKKNCIAHFSTLKRQKRESVVESSEECFNISEQLKMTFLDLKNHERTLRIFETPFDLMLDEAPHFLDLELFNLQSNNALKSQFNSSHILEFY
ncbi:UNVERIFIED_CONTAM: hypothetical protein RMT77_002317 [Armadillidium vulgare]